MLAGYAFRSPLRSLLLAATIILLVVAAPAAAVPADASPLKRDSADAARPTAQLADAMRKRPVPVRRVARSTRVFPNDPLWGDSWSLTKVNALAAWGRTTGTPETIVAVLDTGVDLHQPDLVGSFVAGHDFVNGDDDPSDDHGHGTMVAGVIAARSNNGLGVASACWRCSLMPVKVIGADGSGRAADVAAGILWATDHGARVLNLSFSMSAGDAGVEQAVAYARGRGVVVVAAAGNNGTSDLSYPAAYPGVVSVAGTDPADGRYSWSSFGSWVQLAAPGCNPTTAMGASYGVFCGTSSATAVVSGLAGLARSYSPNLPAAAIEQALAASVAHVGDFVSAGRVDASVLLAALRSDAPARTITGRRAEMELP